MSGLFEPAATGRRSVVVMALALATVAMLGGGVATSACSSSSVPYYSPFVDSGDASTEDTGAILSSPDGATLQPFSPPGDPGPGAFLVTISGESNAISGYPFPPSGNDFANSTFMVDGWEFDVFEYIAVVDKVTLWSDPDLSATDPSRHGGAIAHLDGPFVVDLHKGGPLVGQGGAPEEATPLGVITSQNDNGNASFDTATGTTYGFGFSTVPASWDAYNVNLDASEAADFALMVQNGYSVLYVGSATFKGNDPANPGGCTQTSTGPGLDAGLVREGDAEVSTYGDGGYDFSTLPRTVAFRLGFSTPTNYVNCQNMNLQGMPLPGEDYPRGVTASPSQSTIAQLTVHMDHPFWQSFAENTPVHWDQIAAQYVGVPGLPEAHTEDFVGVAFHPFTDRTGTPLPWRNCVGSNFMPPGDGQMFFSTLSVPVDPRATCSEGDCPDIRDYYDYIRFTQSTQGHLNSQGLCYIDRQFPAPAGGS